LGYREILLKTAELLDISEVQYSGSVTACSQVFVTDQNELVSTFLPRREIRSFFKHGVLNEKSPETQYQ
jgi:hypothetical protein